MAPRVFESITSFNGPATVYKHDGKLGAVDKRGRTIIKPVHTSLYRLDDSPFFASNDDSGEDVGMPAMSTLYGMDGQVIIQKPRKDSMVGAWLNHPYYTACAAPLSSDSHCAMVFVDDQGRDEIRFSDFLENGKDPLVAASTDGVHYGYVDTSLRFVVPPTFTGARPYSDGYAVVSTDQGSGLLDAQGDAVIEPGRYNDIFPDDSALFITAYAKNDRRCGTYVRADGSVVALPEGICPSVLTDGTRKFGYALINGPHGLGTVDQDGVVLIAPQYPLLKGIDRNYLIYADKPGEDAFKGILDRQGRVVLPAQYTSLGVGPRGTFVAATHAGTGLIGLDGKWRVSPRFGGGERVSPDLVAFSMHGAYGNSVGYAFYTSDGTALPYTSLYVPNYLFADGKRSVLKIFGPQHEIGLVALDGRVIAPLLPDVRDVAYVGEGLWKVSIQNKHGAENDLVYDSAGRLLTALQPYSDISRFMKGAATARKNGDAVLIDKAGRQLASYGALFPQYAHRDGDSIVERNLDRCYVVDPSAEPDELAAQSGSDRLICADPTLARLSRQTEKEYFAAQAQSCLPSDYWPLRQPYDKAIAHCGDESCLKQAMLDFEQAIARTSSECVSGVAPLGTSSRPISASLQRTLFKQAERSGELEMVSSDGSALAPGAMDYTRLKMGGREAILLAAPGTAPNGPFWLFSPDSAGRWQTILQDYAGYLRPLEGTDKSRHGMPVLRTQQHASCCEHTVNYYAFDGQHYQTLMSCTQRYDQDDPVLFCDGDPDPEKSAH